MRSAEATRNKEEGARQESEISAGTEGRKLRVMEKVGQILARHDINIDQDGQMQTGIDLRSYTPLQIVSYLTSQGDHAQRCKDFSGVREIKSAISEILAIPTEGLRMKQILDFSESMIKQFPERLRHPSKTGERISDFLESELAPNLRADLRAELMIHLDAVRLGLAYVVTRSRIFESVPIYQTTFPQKVGFFKSGSIESQRHIYGLEVMAIDFCGSSASGSGSRLELPASWELGSGESRRVKAVQKYEMPSSTRQAISDVLREFHGKFDLSYELDNFRPKAIAQHVRWEARLVTPDKNAYLSTFEWERIEADKEAAFARKLQQAADRIAALN